MIERAVALAGRAPSNCNVQPWVIHIASGDTVERLRSTLATAADDDLANDDDFSSIQTYPGVYRTRQVETARLLYGALGIARDDLKARRAAALRNYEMFGAPHAALVFVPGWAGPRELADVGGWAQTFMLALTAQGIASVPQASLGRFSGLTRNILGVCKQHKLLFGISFGWADGDAPANDLPIGRARLDEIVRFHS
jgi:nitroreductase